MFLLYHRSRVNSFYIYKCSELLNYVSDIELSKRIIFLRTCLRFKSLDDNLIKEFWELRDEAFSL